MYKIIHHLHNYKTLQKNTGAEKKCYILVFGQRAAGNIDNSTKIVSSIVGNNLVKMKEEFLEEISLAPSQQLEQAFLLYILLQYNEMPVGFPPISRTGIYLSYNKKRRLTLMNTRKLHHQQYNMTTQLSRVYSGLLTMYM